MALFLKSRIGNEPVSLYLAMINRAVVSLILSFFTTFERGWPCSTTSSTNRFRFWIGKELRQVKFSGKNALMIDPFLWISFPICFNYIDGIIKLVFSIVSGKVAKEDCQKHEKDLFDLNLAIRRWLNFVGMLFLLVTIFHSMPEFLASIAICKISSF